MNTHRPAGQCRLMIVYEKHIQDRARYAWSKPGRLVLSKLAGPGDRQASDDKPMASNPTDSWVREITAQA